MCGESWHAMKDSLTHHPSSQGWAPGVFVQVFCLSPVCTWMEGWGEEGGYLLLCLFSIIYILGLVCYKHTIHIYLSVLNIIQMLMTYPDYLKQIVSPHIQCQHFW